MQVDQILHGTLCKGNKLKIGRFVIKEGVGMEINRLVKHKHDKLAYGFIVYAVRISELDNLFEDDGKPGGILFSCAEA